MATTKQRQDRETLEEARLEERQVHRYRADRFARLSSGHAAGHPQRVPRDALEEG